MRIGSVMFLSGVVLVLQFRDLPSPNLFLSAFVIFLFLFRYLIVRYALWVLAGMAWTCIYSNNILLTNLNPDSETIDLTASGYVISLPELNGQVTRFNFKLIDLKDSNGNTIPSPGKIRLNWYAPFTQIRPGDLLEIDVRLKRPHGYFNPGNFDYEGWLFKEKIRATGYVTRLHSRKPSFSKYFSIHTYRYWLGSIINQYRYAFDNATSLGRALIIGDRSGLTIKHREVLYRTGTSHLIAISGLHIGLAAGIGFFIARWSWSLFRLGMMIMPANRVASLSAFLLASIYACLAGFSVPTQRALIMLSSILLYFNLSRQSQKTTVMSISLLIILLINPLVILSSGFWLSFIAVLLILLTYQSNILLIRKSRYLMTMKVQLFIFVGLLPVIIFSFNQFSISSMLVNLFAIPWLGVITMPLLFTAVLFIPVTPHFSNIMFEAGLTSIDLLWEVLEVISRYGFHYFILPSPGILIMAVAILGGLTFLLSTTYKTRICSICLVLPLVFPVIEKPEHGEFTITVLDVGQGLSVAVQTSKHFLLYDTGPGYNSGLNAGSIIVVPYLQYLGINKIDMLIISHGDMDHIGGLDGITNNLPINKIVSHKSVELGQLETEICHAGRNWHWDGVSFKIFHPEAESDYQGNNASCVLKIGDGRNSVLITGDIEFQAEDKLIDDYGTNLSSKFLVAPHHGSKTSSKSRFIRKVSPDNVIFSTGYLNRFKLPNQDIIKRYLSHGSNTWNTATDGAIHIEYRNETFHFSTERQDRGRFWNR